MIAALNRLIDISPKIFQSKMDLSIIAAKMLSIGLPGMSF